MERNHAYVITNRQIFVVGPEEPKTSKERAKRHMSPGIFEYGVSGLIITEVSALCISSCMRTHSMQKPRGDDENPNFHCKACLSENVEPGSLLQESVWRKKVNGIK